MELTVIIPCLNAEATIVTQLEALRSQRWSKSWEVVVSDNGSTDASMEIVRRYAKNGLLAVRIVDSSDRRRQSHALNVGVRAAAANLLAFCDADDEVAPGWLAALGDALSQHDFVAGQPCFDKFNTREEAEYWSRLWERGVYTRQFLPKAGAGNIAVRRSVHDAIGGFDENLPRFADTDYSWRLQLAGYKIHYEPKAMYHYRMVRVNRSLSSLFRRGWTASATDYWLYKKYRSIGATKDMILPSHRMLKQSSMRWVRQVRAMPRMLMRTSLGIDGQARKQWVEGFVMQSGELYGHVRGRLMNPCTPFAAENVRIILPLDKRVAR